MYDLIEYCDNFSKTSEWLCQFYRNQLPLNNSALTESKWFKFKSAFTITDTKLCNFIN